MGGSSNQKTTTTSSAPSYSKAGLTQAANDTTDWYNSGQGYDQYSGDTVADMTSQTQQGLTNLQNNAYGTDYLYDATNQGLSSLAYNGGLNSGQNDAIAKYQDLYNGDGSFEKAMDYSNSKITDQLNRQFNGLGAFGSGMGSDYGKAVANDLAGNNAEYNFQNQSNKANLANNIFNAYQTGNDNVKDIAGLQGTMHDARDYNANQLVNVGKELEGYTQADIDAAVAAFDKQQGSQKQQLSDYIGLLSGVSGDYGSTTTTKPGQSTLQSLLGYVAGNAGNAAKAFGGGTK
jgi:hypothetical protein